MIRRVFDQAECNRFKRLRENGFSLTACATILKRHRTVLRDIEARGYTPTRTVFRERPADFVAMAARLTWRGLRNHYHCDTKTLQRWLKGVNRAKHKPGRAKGRTLDPCPADFVETYQRLGWMGARAHYKRGNATIRRWKIESGLPISHSRNRRKPAQPQGSWVERYQPTPAYLKLRDQLKAADHRRTVLP